MCISSCGGGAAQNAYIGKQPAQSAVQQIPMNGSSHDHAGMGGAAGADGKTVGAGIRDPQRAEQWLNQIRQSVARFSDVNQARAAGYKLNVEGGTGADQHWINDQVFATGDARNVALPATLMYRFDANGRATLTGIMISARPGTPRPDFGAGDWHKHPDDNQLHMHVWFDKTVQQGAFENYTGTI